MAAGSITEQCALLLPALSAAASGEGEGWRKVEAVDEALVQLRKVVARLHSASKLLVLRREEAPPNPVSSGSTTAVVAGDDPEEEEGEGGPRLPTPRASSLLLTDWSEAASRPGTTSGETASIARTHRRSTAVNESHSFRGAAVVSRSSQPSATCSMSTPSGSRRLSSTRRLHATRGGRTDHSSERCGGRPEAGGDEEVPPSRMRRSLFAPRFQHEWRGDRVAHFLALGPHESAVRNVTFCCLGVLLYTLSSAASSVCRLQAQVILQQIEPCLSMSMCGSGVHGSEQQ